MTRTVKLLIAYDGAAYSGWQRQAQGEITVQAVLEDCLGRICGHPLTVYGAGRTDAGVHALGMVAHFHTTVLHPLAAFSKGLNSLLPPDIRILKAEEATADFHSRFCALAKIYRYDFYTGEVMLPASRLYLGHMPGRFEPHPAERALAYLVGTHDFASFTHAPDLHEGGRGTVRTLLEAQCFPQASLPGAWSIRLKGDGFLRQMVRIIAGTIIECGQGRRDPESIAHVLAACDRRLAGKTAPACGLFLEHVIYPPE